MNEELFHFYLNNLLQENLVINRGSIEANTFKWKYSDYQALEKVSKSGIDATDVNASLEWKQAVETFEKAPLLAALK